MFLEKNRHKILIVKCFRFIYNLINMEVSRARNDTILGRLRTLASCVFIFLGSFLVTYMIESYTNPVGDTNAANFGDTIFKTDGADGLILTLSDDSTAVNVKTNAAAGYKLQVESASTASTIKTTNGVSLDDIEVKITSDNAENNEVNTILITAVPNSIGE